MNEFVETRALVAILDKDEAEAREILADSYRYELIALRDAANGLADLCERLITELPQP